jgi:3-oxoacyl-[acyl-carrier protein] reductase
LRSTPKPGASGSSASGAAAYAAAKGGLLTYTKALAKELGPQGVRVNGVAPGLIITPFHRNSTPETIEKWVTGIPLGRAGSAAEVASTILFLASPAAAFINGETIEINGGMWVD